MCCCCCLTHYYRPDGGLLFLWTRKKEVPVNKCGLSRFVPSRLDDVTATDNSTGDNATAVDRDLLPLQHCCYSAGLSCCYDYCSCYCYCCLFGCLILLYSERLLLVEHQGNSNCDVVAATVRVTKKCRLIISLSCLVSSRLDDGDYDCCCCCCCCCYCCSSSSFSSSGTPVSCFYCYCYYTLSATTSTTYLLLITQAIVSLAFVPVPVALELCSLVERYLIIKIKSLF